MDFVFTKIKVKYTILLVNEFEGDAKKVVDKATFFLYTPYATTNVWWLF
jgi:hypothetical protein